MTAKKEKGRAGYEQVNADLIGCMAYARRKFMDAKTADPKSKSGRAQFAINHIAKLYRVEQNIKGLTADEKFNIRQEKSTPLLNGFKKWLNKTILQVLPKSAIGKAVCDWKKKLDVL